MIADIRRTHRTISGVLDRGLLFQPLENVNILQNCHVIFLNYIQLLGNPFIRVCRNGFLHISPPLSEWVTVQANKVDDTY